MMFFFFLPASIGLVLHSFIDHNWSDKVLALALVLMCLEQARMAQVDLDNIRLVKEKSQDCDQINHFYAVTVITIIVELCGFYYASFSLSWGTIIILISLIFFNVFAKIQLNTSEEIIIKPWSISQRLPILFADGLGLILISLRLLEIFPLLISSVLLGISVLYTIIKYVTIIQFIPRLKQNINKLNI